MYSTNISRVILPEEKNIENGQLVIILKIFVVHPQLIVLQLDKWAYNVSEYTFQISISKSQQFVAAL